MLSIKEKQEVINEFFDEFVTTTETGYFVWKKQPDVKTGNLAGDITVFICKKLDQYDKRRKNHTTR